MTYPLDRAYAEDAPFILPACTGSLFAGRTGEYHGYRFSIHGFYSWRSWAVALAVCEQGDTVVEIGANVGTETVGFRDIVGASGKVVAVEPFPSNISSLQHQVALNGWSNVPILAVAVGERQGTVSFASPPDEHATGIGYIVGRGGGSPARVIDVECVSLDSLAEKIGPARAIFCDTEGAEVMVLRGARSYLRQYQPALVLEASPKLLARSGTSLSELWSILRDAGYQPFAIDRLGVSRVDRATASKASNWLCVPNRQAELAHRCAEMIRTCALRPCLQPLNPLCRRET
jgi:FkbM family methyltransferase